MLIPAHAQSYFVFTSCCQAGDDGTLFGSITKSDVVALIKDQLDLSVETQDIEMGDIRTTGSHELSVKLHPEVVAKVRTVRNRSLIQ